MKRISSSSQPGTACYWKVYLVDESPLLALSGHFDTCGRGPLLTQSGHISPKGTRRLLQNEIGVLQRRDVALQTDAEIRHAVAIHIPRDDGVASLI